MGNTTSYENITCIERSKLKLRPHQEKVINYLLEGKTDGILLVHPTGTGKTLTGVTASQCFLEAYPKSKVIFVGPSSLISNFKKELENYGVNDFSRYRMYSYQKFLQLEEETREMLCKKSMLIVDEVHNLRTLKLTSPKAGRRSKAVFSCSKFAEKRLLLTATPFVNDLTDFIPIINFIYGKTMVYKKSDANNIKKIVPFLKGKIDYIDVPEESKKEYPDFEEQYIKIKMNKEYEEDYCRIVKGNEIKGDYFQKPEAFYNAHRRAVNKIGKGKVYFSDKTKKAISLIEDKKTVIYSNWLDFGLRPISETLNNRNITNRTFSGELSMREKKKVIDDFNGDKFQVLIISKSGSEGLDLKGVRNVIVMDPVWNYAGIKQIRGRAVRFRSHIGLPKSERKVDIYYMILETGRKDCKSGDSVVYEIIKQKKKNSDMIDKSLQKISI